MKNIQLNQQFPATLQRGKTTFYIRREFIEHRDLLTAVCTFITKAQTHEKSRT